MFKVTGTIVVAPASGKVNWSVGPSRETRLGAKSGGSSVTRAGYTLASYYVPRYVLHPSMASQNLRVRSARLERGYMSP